MALTNAERLQMVAIALMKHNVVGSSGSESSFVAGGVSTALVVFTYGTTPALAVTTIDVPT